jgi:Na+/H+-dicarboxylate symporter
MTETGYMMQCLILIVLFGLLCGFLGFSIRDIIKNAKDWF